MSIHPTAVVDPKAQLGLQVTVGPFSVVGENVQLGDGCTVGSHCLLGEVNHRNKGRTLVIGASSTIRSHSVFYLGSSFQDGLVTGHGVTVREGTRAGLNLQIGTLSDIQGDCTFGDYVRLHSNVFLGQQSQVNNFVWIYPYVVLTNDPHPPSETCLGCRLEEFSVIATMTVILPGVTVGQGSLVGAHSLVTRDVPAGMVCSGSPARVRGPVSDLTLRDGTNTQAYPWTRHFRRGFPPEVTEQW